MIVTKLDKASVRAATTKLIRSGKFKRQPCELCGAAQAQYRHIDYTDPEHLRWLCKRHLRQEGLSELQRSLLREGLFAWNRSRPLDIACGLPDPGHFDLKTIMTKYKDRTERAAKRASAGRAIARLIKRRLLERCSRGRWRLSGAGVAIARRLYPQIKPVTKQELAHHIAFHQAMQSTLAGKRRRRF
jgi:hypothetical protein